MERKDLEVRLEVIKLLATIGDSEGIALQVDALKQYNEPQIDEIVTLLEGNNIRQALYLIKNYKIEHFSEDTFRAVNDDQEVVLGVEDMLRMSPLAKETLNVYRAQAYTQEDLDKFSQNIIKNSEDSRGVQESQKEKREDKKSFNEKESLTNESEMNTLIESADKNLPLDEISAQVIGKSEKEKRSKVLSKYRTLREKFAKKESKKEERQSAESKENNAALKVSTVTEEILEQSKENIVKEEREERDAEAITKVEEREKKEEQSATIKSTIEENKTQTNTIYPPIPHIEEKFRKFFTLYPPLKESDVWVEVVIKFLKQIAKESYTERDVEAFLDEFDYFVKRGDIVRASQVILLAGATDSQLAQFRLARELFSGKILQRNIKASFAIIKKLAEEFYPEAVCDLAQFYEYGLGVSKDKKVALKLYEKAFELGSIRASKHINRLKESNNGFLSSLLKLS